MGVLNASVYAAEVHYYGGVRPDDPDEEQIRAWVEAPEPPPVAENRDALTFLVALLGPYHLRLAGQGNLHMVEPMIELIDEGAKAMLASESDARELTFEHSNLYVDMPKIIEESEGKAERRWVGTLMQAKANRNLWVKSRSRNPYFGMAGHLCLVEHLAKTGDYENAVVPAAVGMKTFINLFDTIEESWQSMGGGVVDLLNEPIIRFVLADDPRRVLADSEQRVEAVRQEHEADSNDEESRDF